MDQAWIIVANPANMARVAKAGVFGLNQKSVLAKAMVGDGVVAYIKGDKMFAGLGRVVESYYMDDEPLFEGGLYPDRIGIELVLLPVDQRKDIFYFLDDLTYMSDKTRWAASLVAGIKRISPVDYAVFARHLQGPAT